MKAIQPSNHKISTTFNHFFSLLRRFFSKLPALSYGADISREDVLGLYSYKTLWRRSGTFSAVVLGMLVLFTIFPLYIIYSTVEAATTSQAEPTITITASNATASLDLLVKNPSGTVASNGTPASFSVYTNNYTGYTLSIKSNSSNTALTNTTNSSYSLSSISSSTTNANNIANGSWAYMPSKYNSTANTTTYYPSPTTTATTLDNVSSAGTNNYTIGIAAKADYSKVAGNYSNTYTLTAVVNGFNYRITYNKGNTTDTVTNLPATQSANAVSSSSIKLRADTPARSGYTFNGWCSVMPTTTNGSDSCSGDRYWTMNIVSGPTYYFNKKINNANITLYAMWEEVKIYMQDLTFDLCPATVTKVYDKRDEKDYQIVKINDVCWMVQNLRFTGTSLDTETSNVDTDKTITYYDLEDNGSSGGQCYSTNSYSNACIKDSGSTTTGVWYNFIAASAMYATKASNSTNYDYDICPAGWHLPSGSYSANGTDGYSVFQNTAYQSWISENNASAPLKAYFKVTGGYYYNGSLYNAAQRGAWWSATSSDAANRYTLLHETSYGFYSSNNGRGVGLFVRCVMTPPKTYMQDVTSTDIANMTELKEYTMYDKRDGSDYTVKKINGQLWMTQNLRITGTIDNSMTPKLSNFSASSFNVSQYDLANTTYCNGGSSSSSPKGYSNVCSKSPSRDDYGVYYNYAAATAGTITGYNNMTKADQDICPAGWHLPSGPNTTSNTDFNKLIGNTTSNWQPPTANLVAFDGVSAGNYTNGTPRDTGTNGGWWSATVSIGYDRRTMYYRNGDGYFYGDGSASRYVGLSVRCTHD